MRQPLPYTIRPMEMGDVPIVVAIDRLSFPAPWPAASYRYELRSKNKSFYHVLLRPAADKAVPADKGWHRWLHRVIGPTGSSRVIGYVGLRKQIARLEVHISTLAIHPDWRGNGLGELMLLAALEQAQELEFSTVSLEVRASNQSAQRLYRKYVFRFKSVQQGYYRNGEGAWLMTVDIDRSSYQRRLAELGQALEAQLLRQQTEQPPAGQSPGRWTKQCG